MPHDTQTVDRAERLALLLLAVAALAVALVLVWLFDPAKINPDTLQLIDTARYLRSGDGLTSGIVYYDAQLAFGRVPAPMTIWPPGFPSLLVAGMSLGASGEATAYTLCLIAHLAAAFLLYFGLRRVAVSPVIAALAGFVWLVHPTALNLAVVAFAEPIYTAFTLASCIALVEALRESPRWRVWLAVSGVSAACAVLMRYNGVLWPAAAGLCLAVLAVRRRSWKPIGIAIAFGALPALVTIGLFWRNFVLSGHLSGGQFEYGGAAAITEVARRFYWGTDLLFGAILTAQPLVFASVLAVLIAAVIATARHAHLHEPRTLLLTFAVVNTAIVSTFLLYNAVRSSIVFIDYRYWMPAVPLLLIAIAIVTDAAVTKLRSRHAGRSRVWPAAIALSAATLAVSAAAQVVPSWPFAQPHPAKRIIREALQEQMPDGRTLGTLLSGSADAPHLLLSNEERRVGSAIHIKVVGLPIARYTQHVWSDDTVASLIRRYGVSQVLFFPATYEDEFKIPFYRELREGQVPPWLTVRFRGKQVVLYDVVASELR